MTVLLMGVVICLLPLSVMGYTMLPLDGGGISDLKTDPSRPYTYALETGITTSEPGRVLVIDNGSMTIFTNIPVGPTPTSMDIDPDNQYLYVIHYATNLIIRIDLETFWEKDRTNFPPRANHWRADHYELQAGSNRLYYVDAEWWPILHIFEYATGSHTNQWLNPSGAGYGDIFLSQDNHTLFHWNQVGWWGSSGDGRIGITDVSSDIFSLLVGSGSLQSSLLAHCPILMSKDETSCFVGTNRFDTSDLANPSIQYPENIYALASRGELIAGHTKLLNAVTAEGLAPLPYEIDKPAVFTESDLVLVYYVSSSNMLVMLDPEVAFTVPESTAAMEPFPVDGALASLLVADLTWQDDDPKTYGYEVYFSTNLASVAGATTGSGAHVSSTANLSFNLAYTERFMNTRYYWRVDCRKVDGTVVTGAVWQFATPPFDVDQTNVFVAALETFSPPSHRLSITADQQTAWQVYNNADWMDIAPSSGAGPGTLALSFSTDDLPRGVYEDHVRIYSGTNLYSVPVILRVMPANVKKWVTDYSRPYIYGLQQDPFYNASWWLVVFNADTRSPEAYLNAGIYPTDLTVNWFDDLLYIADSESVSNPVVDLATFSLTTPLRIQSNHTYIINAGLSRRVFTENNDPFLARISSYDLANTSMIYQAEAATGDTDAELSRDGKVYYRINTGSQQKIVKYDVSGSTNYTKLIEKSLPSAGKIIISQDGNRLASGSYILDTNLNVISRRVDHQTLALNSSGEIAVYQDGVYHTPTTSVVFRMSQISSAAFSGDEAILVASEPNQEGLHILSVPEILKPTFTQSPECLLVMEGQSAAFAASVDGVPEITYQWQYNRQPIPDATQKTYNISTVTFTNNGDYSLLASNSYGVATSSYAHLTVRSPPIITDHPVSLSVYVGATVQMDVEAVGTPNIYYRWLKGTNFMSGEYADRLVLVNVGPDDQDTYRALLGNDFGSSTSVPAQLEVRSWPDITLLRSTNSEMTVVWPESLLLQHADFLEGPYLDATGFSPYVFPVPSANQQFFRLIHNR